MADLSGNTSGMGKNSKLPDGIKGWSWGALLWNVIWVVFNRTWIGLLCLLPLVGIIMTFMLGLKGREWAWRNKKWDSVEHFNKVQGRWSFWGVALIVAPAVTGILAALLVPIFVSQPENQTAKVMAPPEPVISVSHMAKVDMIVHGKIMGELFTAERAVFDRQAGKITFKIGKRMNPELGIKISTSLFKGDSILSGKSFVFDRNTDFMEKASIVESSASSHRTNFINSQSYTLKISFGSATDVGIPVTIDFVIDDNTSTFLKGRMFASFWDVGIVDGKVDVSTINSGLLKYLSTKYIQDKHPGEKIDFITSPSNSWNTKEGVASIVQVYAIDDGEKKTVKLDLSRGEGGWQVISLSENVSATAAIPQHVKDVVKQQVVQSVKEVGAKIVRGISREIAKNIMGTEKAVVSRPNIRNVADVFVPGDTFMLLEDKSLKGVVFLDNRKHIAYLKDAYKADGDFTNDGIFVDLNDDGVISEKGDEFFQPGTIHKINETRYRIHVTWN